MLLGADEAERKLALEAEECRGGLIRDEVEPLPMPPTRPPLPPYMPPG